jgi:hypothetical protein
MKTEKEQEQILEELRYCSGTESYHKIPFSDLIYTDGINELIEKAGCWWLVSDMGILISATKKLQKDFLILSIKVNEDNTAEVTLKEDSNLKPIYSKVYNYTDFPLKEFELYIIDKVMLLKSEN